MGQSRKLLRSSGPPWVRIPRLPPPEVGASVPAPMHDLDSVVREPPFALKLRADDRPIAHRMESVKDARSGRRTRLARRATASAVSACRSRWSAPAGWTAPSPVARPAPVSPAAVLDQLIDSIAGDSGAVLASVDGFPLAKSASMPTEPAHAAMLAAAIGLARQLVGDGRGAPTFVRSSSITTAASCSSGRSVRSGCWRCSPTPASTSGSCAASSRRTSGCSPTGRGSRTGRDERADVQDPGHRSVRRRQDVADPVGLADGRWSRPMSTRPARSPTSRRTPRSPWTSARTRSRTTTVRLLLFGTPGQPRFRFMTEHPEG